MLVPTPRSVEFFRHNFCTKFQDGLHTPPAYSCPITAQLQFPDLRARYEPDNVARFLAAQPSLPEYLTTLDIDPPELPDEFGRRVDKLR